MASYNKVLLMGNITRDIEVRHLPSGNAVATIGLAVNRKWRDQAGELKEEVTFVDCEAFSKTAETMAKFLSKGKPVFIEGRLRLDQWQDKQSGENRSKLKVIIESFEFIDSKAGGGEGGSGAGGGGSNYSSRPAPARTGAGGPPPSRAPQQDHVEIEKDDIPF
ncbi:MAG: single-stranded DNA-binding protein [Phycisphaerales bacterium]|nr:single-stranded DNA-binding protein [Phycisphaerales bacterium]